jgi:hypothetical protein
MKNTSQINPSIYGCYYIHPSLDLFALYLRTPEGDVEYTNYDLFTADDKTIIAFKHFEIAKTEYNYLLVSDGKESIVQWTPFEYVSKHLNQTEIEDTDIFCILNSVSVPNLIDTTPHKLGLPYEERCDLANYGAIEYDLIDGDKEFVMDPSSINMQTIKFILPILNVTGVQYIEYFRVEGMGTSYRDWPAVAGVAKTLMGAMKLIIEWASLANDPFNLDDEMVTDSNNFLEALELGQEVIDEISEYQEDMPVYRYLKNVNDARHNFEESCIVSPLFRNWLLAKFRYVSLNSLVANYPEVINIDNLVLETENTAIETVIHETCEILQLDSETMTAATLLEYIDNPTISNPKNLNRSELIKARKALLSYLGYN